MGDIGPIQLRKNRDLRVVASAGLVPKRGFNFDNCNIYLVMSFLINESTFSAAFKTRLY